MAMDNSLLKLLVCPACKSEIKLLGEESLVCQNPACQLEYPIRQGIPVMLVSESKKYQPGK